jgi:hypothetical protein
VLFTNWVCICCLSLGVMARRDEGAYPNGSVTEEQRRQNPQGKATL